MGNAINLTPILEGLIILCLSLATGFAIPWLLAHVEADKLSTLGKWVEIAVAAAEQIGRCWKGSEKKQYVLNFLSSRGYTIDEAEIDALIESAVLQLHRQIYEYFDDGKDDDVGGEADDNA